MNQTTQTMLINATDIGIIQKILLNSKENCVVVDENTPTNSIYETKYILDTSNSKKFESYQNEIFHYINNPDGTIRWIYPDSTKFPSFLALYNASSLKAKLIKTAMVWAFKLKFRKVFNSGSFRLFYKGSFPFQALLSETQAEGYSIFTGTKGENRKCIVEINKSKKTTDFIKIPLSDKSLVLVQREKQQLEYLGSFQFQKAQIPVITPASNPDIAILSNIKPSLDAQTLMDITPLHIEVLSEWYEKTNQEQKVYSLDSFVEINKYLSVLNKKKKPINDLAKEKSDALADGLANLRENIDENLSITTAITHTDFTPWNMYAYEERLYVYDWELSRSDMPLLFDAFHLIFQSHILIKRSPFNLIKDDIEKLRQMQETKAIVEKYKIDFDWVYRYYLLFNVSYYLKLYKEQKELHAQAHWLIDTWLEAVKDAQ